MEAWVISVLIRPFVLLAILGFVVFPIKFALFRIIPDGKLKSKLFANI